MRNIILVICVCFMCVGCSTKQSTMRGTNLIETDDSWKTNQIIIKAAESSGNLDIALSTANSEIVIRPDNMEARIILANLLTRTGQPGQALITLEPMQNKPTSEMCLEMARAELSLGNTQQAINLLGQAESKTPSRTTEREIKKLRAVGSDLLNDHKSAQNLYRSLLSEYDELGVRYNYGRSLIASGDYKQAVTMLLPLIERYEFPQARVAAAAAMAKSKDFAGARNLLHGYMPEEDINRILAGEKL